MIIKRKLFGFPSHIDGKDKQGDIGEPERIKLDDYKEFYS